MFYLLLEERFVSARGASPPVSEHSKTREEPDANEKVRLSRGAAAALCRGAGPTVSDDGRNLDLLGRAACGQPGQEDHGGMPNPVAEATGMMLSPLRGCFSGRSLARMRLIGGEYLAR
ncbi:hypothetical protein K227x_19030 [Rubripirellula lacrimiformis]|uniref:Uncharacterized protein n=1 Tax=Rubripirellula lacrimiformis TaxID=1930273 RepID=A0A517N8Q5_9BACT|nr:hypothetical protein K227x_19030 [Rubripirellula lacrimiformis]